MKKKNFLKYDKPKLIPHLEGLDSAILCDLDGTLAWLNGRSPFSYTKCDTDLLNPHIAKILDRFTSTHKIILITGRVESCRSQTEKWLKQNKVHFDFLYMKPDAEVSRKDTETKKEIFEKYIRNRYNVEFVLEDRDRIVQLWRELGLICLQVAEGAF